ncbi:hypothetical protein FS749_014075 [Ceratobasidium sp. UAMH 11750]|nr:hypothetical protein FS749_014075 [Ceratobasidium sp. UAMH 11750]
METRNQQHSRTPHFFVFSLDGDVRSPSIPLRKMTTILISVTVSSMAHFKFQFGPGVLLSSSVSLATSFLDQPTRTFYIQNSALFSTLELRREDQTVRLHRHA